MLNYLIDLAGSLQAHRTHVVIGNGADSVKAAFPDIDINWVLQTEQKGTGHAVQQVMPHVDPDARLLILLGDAPLVSLETVNALISTKSELSVLTVCQPDPTNYGRIIRSDDGQIAAIVEERDATPEQRQISEINTGVMCADAESLRQWIQALTTDNDQGEYILTDIVALARKSDMSVLPVMSGNSQEVQGINTLSQLASAERYFQRSMAEQLMDQGVRIVDPMRFDLRGSLAVGTDVTLDINCVIEGSVSLGDRVRIDPNVVLKDCVIGDNVHIKANTVIDGAVIGNDCQVRPFARLRPGTELRQNALIGNFVEVKKSVIGEGSKASHLTYLGDATLGDGVNIGAGTITCNYDGVNKFQTTIGDGAFIGSNTSLVAPVTVGKQATTGAGSTITKDVSDKGLALGRARQTEISNWKDKR